MVDSDRQSRRSMEAEAARGATGKGCCGPHVANRGGRTRMLADRVPHTCRHRSLECSAGLTASALFFSSSVSFKSQASGSWRRNLPRVDTPDDSGLGPHPDLRFCVSPHPATCNTGLRDLGPGLAGQAGERAPRCWIPKWLFGKWEPQRRGEVCTATHSYFPARRTQEGPGLRGEVSREPTLWASLFAGSRHTTHMPLPAQ